MPADPFSATLNRLARAEVLLRHESEQVFSQIMAGEVSPIQMAAFLMALRVRGESTEELIGAVSAMRTMMRRVDGAGDDAVDVCGTGGDGHGTLNVSTAVAFVLAAMGVPVAKHGNRAQSSRSGASDVLEALGVPLLDDPRALSRMLSEEKLVFLAAALHHPVLSHAAQVRKGLGIRTIFNLLGPLCNPASVRRQLIGVYDTYWLGPVVETLQSLGALAVWAVHGFCGEKRSGVDELTLAGISEVVACEEGRILRFSITPEDAGLSLMPISAIAGGDAAYNAQALESLLRGSRGVYRDTVLLNAAAALHVAGYDNILQGDRISPRALQKLMAKAGEVLDNGRAYEVLRSIVVKYGKTER